MGLLRKCLMKAPAGLLVAAFACLLLVGVVTPATAKPVKAEIEATPQQGYGRIVLDFEHLPGYESTVDDTIMVFRFKEQVDLDFSQLVTKLPDYLGVARVDPDGRAFRVAFVDSFKVNIMEAGNKIFIDILGRNWTGMPPNLPQDVVRAITRRAAEIEEKNREVERQRRETQASYKAQLRVGALPTFSRLVFDWNKFVTARMERAGETVTLTFGRPVDLDVGRVKHNLPNDLLDISSAKLAETTVVKLKLPQDAKVRGYREAEDYVVDISPEAVKLSAQLQKLEQKTLDENGNPIDRAEVELLADDDKTKKMNEFSAAKDQVALVRSTYSAFNPDDFSLEVFGDQADGAALPAVRGDQPLFAGRRTVAETPGPRDGAAGEAVAGDKKAPAGLKPSIIERANVSEITFPFDEVVPAAGFIRGDTIWIVFDSFRDIDLSDIVASGAKIINDIRKTRLNNGQLILIKLTQPMLFAFGHDQLAWTARIGDMVTADAEALKLKRRISPERHRYFSIDMARPSHVYWLRDDTIGDRVGLVTSYPPVVQLTKPQNFVEFSTFGTAHGIALTPKSDDVEIRVGFQEVVIARGGGLHLSDKENFVKRSSFERKKPGSSNDGLIDFAGWRNAGNGSFMDQLGNFESRVALAEPAFKFAARRDYARFLLANELALESLGLLQRIVNEAPERQNDPEIRLMQAAANVMMRRPQEAIKALSLGALYNNDHASLWRGMAKLMLAQWSDALRQFRSGENALDLYPDVQRARFQLAAARAALALNNYDLMERYLRAVPRQTGERDIDMNSLLLNAQYMVAVGRGKDARRLFDIVADSEVAPAAAKAKIERLEMLLKENELSRPEAINQLEGLQIMWRGDETELEMLSLLSRLYADEGEYRMAFANMKQAVKAFPTQEAALKIQDEMAKVFKALFLQNKVTDMRPIEALSLFYDYKELTPIGRTGDDMIRMLADRLIDVDLLDHAAELLDHQVNNRVRGAARSQVAAKLAMVHLMNRKPELSLQAIGRSRQPDLPNHIKRARDILEARSLSELGQVDGAVDILNRLKGAEVERMKADAYWNAQQWDKAGEQLEKLLGSSWNDGEALQPFERQDVLRAAISYSLAQDAFALSRLRKKFYNKMVNSPDANSFIVVTKPVKKDGMAYKRLAKDLASINTLDAFMKQYRDHYKDTLGAENFSSGPSQPGAL